MELTFDNEMGDYICRLYLKFMRVILTVGLFLCIHTLLAQRLSNNSFQLVNSSYDELNPVVSPDGQMLYITIANHAANIGEKETREIFGFPR